MTLSEELIKQITEKLGGISEPDIFEQDFFIKVKGTKFSFPRAKIEAFVAERNSIQVENETEQFHNGLYEHAIQFEGSANRRMMYRRRFAEENEFLLASQCGNWRVEIGPPSLDFTLRLLTSESLDFELKRMLRMPIRTSDTLDASRLFRFETIKITYSGDNRFSLDRFRDIAESSLYHVSFAFGESITLPKTWERTYFWLGRRDDTEVQFPRLKYDRELVSYYSLGLGTDSLVLSFLAFYNILEFLFTKVVEEELHKKLKDAIASPTFSHTKPAKLRELTTLVKKYEQRIDELSALKLVLKTYFDASEIIDWINDYEERNGTVFSEEKEIFSRRQKIDLNSQQVMSSLANRIYGIRNALVHNKEGEIARFIPFSGQEKILENETQLIKFLAEQIIHRTASDLKI
ncbi:hypothetical protein [Celeribacter sp.]|uniref:hypothetical protein n=1 Tax=Celeribacter sp. TaxID=1890673 RepID=UPI003A8D948C